MTMMHDTDRLLRSRLSNHTFLGTVSAVSGNRIKVIRPGQTGADTTFYAAASGLAAAVVAGDTVLVVRAGASWVAVCKIVS